MNSTCTSSFVATVASAARCVNRSYSSNSGAAAARSKVMIEKISARVFCPLPTSSMSQHSSTVTGNNVALMDDGTHQSPNSGGNPVTIFKILLPTTTTSALTTNASPPPQPMLLSPDECSQIAASCEWESVFVFPSTPHETEVNTVNSNNILPSSPQLNMAFYLPTGKPVSFCAHAAMGGAYAYFFQSHQHHFLPNSHNNNNTSSNSHMEESSSASSISSDSKSSNRVQLNLVDTETTETTTKGTPTNDTSNVPTTNYNDPRTKYAATYHRDDTNVDHTSGTIALEVQNIVWQQEPIEQPTTLHRILREYHKVNGSTDCTLPMIEVLPTEQQWQDQNLDQYEPQILKTKYNKAIPLPTFVNSWVGDRKKTLVYINRDHTLQTRILPPPPRAAEQHYPAACDSLQHTTGLYLFATKTTIQDALADQREIKLDYPALDPNNEHANVWECRQFPRQSGYAEDPATGVAAAALAISLRFCEIETQRIVGYDTNHSSTGTSTSDDYTTTVGPSSKYEFYQGTAMHQPSYIVVDNIQVHSLVTQEEEEKEPQHSQVSSVAQEELSIFKYATIADDENSPTTTASNVIAENMNHIPHTSNVLDDETLEKEAANVDLFKHVDDDVIWEENDDNDDDDEEEEDHDDAAAVTTTTPPPPPKKDYRYHKHRGLVSFVLTGRIEIDHIERMEV